MANVPSWWCHSLLPWPPGSPVLQAALRTLNEQPDRSGPNVSLRCGREPWLGSICQFCWFPPPSLRSDDDVGPSDWLLLDALEQQATHGSHRWSSVDLSGSAPRQPSSASGGHARCRAAIQEEHPRRRSDPPLRSLWCRSPACQPTPECSRLERTLRPNSTPRPSFFASSEEKARWSAWRELGSKAPVEAMYLYTQAVEARQLS